MKTFKRSRVPQLIPPAKKRARASRWRGSRQERGYGADWDKKRVEILQRDHGLCQECLRRGYAEFGNVVDHILPLEDFPELRLVDTNLEVICEVHHNGFKRKLEGHARKVGLMEMLPQWIKFPDSRPARFQILKFGPLGKPDARRS